MERFNLQPTKKTIDQIESAELIRLQKELQLAIEALAIPVDWKNQIDTNPYRFKDNSGLIYTQWDETPKIIKDFYSIRHEYILFLNQGSEDGQSHLSDTLFLDSLAVLKELY
jgi:hypothetical protein